MIDLLKTYVVVGGDAIAPMIAGAIANSLCGQEADVILIEPAESFSRAESLIPQSASFHRQLGIAQAGLVGHTAATFKLATEFTGWVAHGDRFLHPYGQHGSVLRLLPFHHYAVRERLTGADTDFNDYSLAAVAARLGKFELPESDPASLRSTYAYGLHVDVDHYADLFRAFSDHAGVRRIEGRVVNVSLRPEDGFVEHVQLENGTRVDGDFFVDCSGCEAKLAGGALELPYEDWSDYLPCDSSVTVSVTDTIDFSPVTRIVAKSSGWLQRIQLRNRGDYEFLYDRDVLSDDQAHASLRADVRGATKEQARLRHFTNGVRRSAWRKNCIALGESAVCLEPLEISGIGLAQMAVLRFLAMLPDRHCDPAISGEYNRLLDLEYDNVRDYLSLFYASTRRGDEGFWARCAELKRPASLDDRLDLFASHGRLLWNEQETFPEEYWISALLGLGHWPRRYHPLADVPGDEFVSERLTAMREQIQREAHTMRNHRHFVLDYLRQNAPAGSRPGD